MPESPEDLRSFIAAMRKYSHRIPNFGAAAAPLAEALRMWQAAEEVGRSLGKAEVWDVPQARAFATIKVRRCRLTSA